MERPPENGVRRHGGGGVTVTHHSDAYATFAVCEHHNARTALDSPPTYLPSDPANAVRRRSDGRIRVASSHGASHAPAVWLFEDSLPARGADAISAAAPMQPERDGADDDEVDGAWQQRLLPQLAHPRVVDNIELNASAAERAVGVSEAPSPRVLHNRLAFPVPRSTSIDNRRSRSLPPHAALVSAPPEEVTEDQLSASTSSYAPSPTDTRTQTWVSTTPSSRKQQRRPRPAPPSSSPPPPRLPAASAFASASSARRSNQREATAHSPESTGSATSSSSASSRSSSSASAQVSARKKDATLTSSFAHQPIAASSRVTSLAVEGLGPLMVVHLDVLPELRGLAVGTTGDDEFNARGAHHGAGYADDAGNPHRSTALVVNPQGQTDTRAAKGPGGLDAVRSPHGQRDEGSNTAAAAAAAAVQALVTQEAQEAHTREVAALYAELEVAEQRARIAEQQVTTIAELRAAELVRDYRADERKRRAQFQASLDTLREENRELTAKLEAAARAPAMGLLPYPQLTSTAASTTRPAEGGGPLTAVVVSEVDVARQVQSVEAYWRDRLRNAERHWEDEMAQQIRQRREALDQVDELVRTVEQMQEELRYTRRQAARLREENVRLSSAASAVGVSSATASTTTALSTSGQLPSAAVPADEVARLRRALKEHEYRETALLAQVESYGEEATQVRLRYEAALERAQQDVAAERRRSTEMVKLYGSQLESLHHQLREAKAGSAPR
jgi:hypothetical protein